MRIYRLGHLSLSLFACPGLPASNGLWYQRPGMRHWLEAAAEVFTTTYRQAMLELGVANTAVDGILQCSRLYEAALLFKIATRRVNRLNSPRPKELSAMLSEIAACLANDVRGK